MTASSRDTRIKVLACRQVYQGINTAGHQYTIYEIDAARENGQVIDAKLRSFGELPLGQVVEVTVTPFDSERHGRSYTVQLKTSRGHSTVEQMNELARLVVELGDRLESLQSRLEALEGAAKPPVAAPAQGQNW